MGQRRRHDAPGRRHHVMNRGMAKRVIFPDHAAKQRFLALIACSVRRGELRVEAVCVMDTHFHLLASTPDGRIHYPMMRILNAYARYFNRRHKRDGSPYRGRFFSVPVLSNRHWHTLIRYIDRNPVKAGIVSVPVLYRYGSAIRYATRRRGPPWLARAAVERRVRATSGKVLYDPRDYVRAFGIASEDEVEIIERRVRRPATGRDELGHVDRLPHHRIAAWMRRKARLADGLSPWSPMVGSEVVIRLTSPGETRLDDLSVRPTRNAWPARTVLVVGLLHDAAGLTLGEIGARLGCATSTAGRRLMIHRQALASDSTYTTLAAEILRSALDATYPSGPPA